MSIWFRLFGSKTPEALMRACIAGDLRRVEALLKHGGVASGGPLYAAAEAGHFEVARLLVEYGSPVDYRIYRTTHMGAVGDYSEYENTTLRAAVVGGHRAVAELLLAHGADPDEATSYGTQNPSAGPLNDATARGDIEMAQLLLRHGAAPDGSGDRPPLHSAAAAGHVYMMKLLLDAGANSHRRLQGH